MTEKEKLIEKEFEDIDQALRRAAQAAKKIAELHGTPYVVTENISGDTLKQKAVTYKR
ncbi:hypothetical protein Q9292_01585 [Methylophilus sp. VKM B-3414]|uniref:hypothetical protein n=1 Tax=Methylophilus sp. VKM B-3414 TaxID=3076121 RepID=UPI0028C6B450|nr:hypothetical protein [Methylophilus sp. VKM B-3414]MDT7848286.1 hypothetical protein [Methylophilus sp. VKM B-3414]